MLAIVSIISVFITKIMRLSLVKLLAVRLVLFNVYSVTGNAIML